MNQRDIERLRALEKKWYFAESDIYDAGGFVGLETVRGMRKELATLITELGQEVGAVADPVGVLTVRRWRGIDAMVNHDFEYLGHLPDGTYSLFTSPAHTSEARDAARLDFMVRRCAVVDYCKGARDAMYRVSSFGTLLCDWHDTAREAIDAAMRQEGGK